MLISLILSLASGRRAAATFAYSTNLLWEEVASFEVVVILYIVQLFEHYQKLHSTGGRERERNAF